MLPSSTSSFGVLSSWSVVEDVGFAERLLGEVVGGRLEDPV